MNYSMIRLALFCSLTKAFVINGKSNVEGKVFMVEDDLFNPLYRDGDYKLPNELSIELVDSEASGDTRSQLHYGEKRRRKMELMWCGRETCKDVIRERVVGENHLEFDGPATGQVCYVWDEESDSYKSRKQSVFIILKHGDEELTRVVADAVRELISLDIEILVAPDLAAKLKHYFGVDDEKIKLFEPRPVPGFGGNHVSMDDELMGEFRSNMMEQTNPDLVCTLGGDGLLMHASMMFQASCPPILCIAGGSLGFLTRFSRNEMVKAISISLGLSKSESDFFDENNYEEIRPSYKFFKESMSTFNLGLGDRICISMRMRLDVRVINREGVVRARFNVLNEVVIDRGASPFLSALECFVDDLHLTTVQADGIIFAT
jgi:NAD kinase